MESESIWRMFILDLSKQFTRNNVERLLYHFEVPDGEGEQITNGIQLLKYLNENNIITKENVRPLYNAVRVISKKKLQETLKKYEERISPILEKERLANVGSDPPEDDIEISNSRHETCPSFQDAYKMNAEPRGLCVIINNRFDNLEDIFSPEGFKLKKRNGSDVDRDKLQNLFTWLKFKVTIYNNVSHSYLETILHLHSDTEEKNKLYDCFVCCILSHGYEKGFYCNDGKRMDFFDLRSFFTGDNCEDLIGKPKLFFVQACQGNIEGSWGLLKSDGPPRSATPNLTSGQPDEAGLAEITQPIKLSADADFLFFVSSVPGTLSWRHPMQGTWFIQDLKDVFIESAQKDHLMDMCLKVNRKISERWQEIGNGKVAKMMSDFGMNSLRKKLFFIPAGPYDGPYDFD